MAPPRGVWGHAPIETFEILGALRRILEAPEVMIIPVTVANSQGKVYNQLASRQAQVIGLRNQHPLMAACLQ